MRRRLVLVVAVVGVLVVTMVLVVAFARSRAVHDVEISPTPSVTVSADEITQLPSEPEPTETPSNVERQLGQDAAGSGGWEQEGVTSAPARVGEDNASIMSIPVDTVALGLTDDAAVAANETAAAFVAAAWTFDDTDLTPRAGLERALDQYATPELRAELDDVLTDPNMGIGTWSELQRVEAAWAGQVYYTEPDLSRANDAEHYAAVVSYGLTRSLQGQATVWGEARFAIVELRRSGESWAVAALPDARENALIP